MRASCAHLGELPFYPQNKINGFGRVSYNVIEYLSEYDIQGKI